MIHTARSPEEVLRHRMSALPSPLKSRLTFLITPKAERAWAILILGFVTVPPGRVSLIGTPVCWSAARMVLTEAPGTACFRTAHAPVTCGAAKEVPLKVAY